MLHVFNSYLFKLFIVQFIPILKCKVRQILTALFISTLMKHLNPTTQASQYSVTPSLSCSSSVCVNKNPKSIRVPSTALRRSLIFPQSTISLWDLSGKTATTV